MRLFVALDFPHAAKQQIAILAGGIPGARWVAPANYHLTLRFIGEQQPGAASEIDAALGMVRGRSFSLALGGIGTFEKAGRSTALWLGVKRSEALERLRAKVETALVRAGLALERRRFSPHVSLARLDNAPEARVVTYVQAHNLFRADPIEIGHFTLFRSRPGKEQPVYTVEVEYPLDVTAPTAPGNHGSAPGQAIEF